ncbi:MAG: amino acid racemase [Paracoccus sp. (in: a-proteobacteria)]
MVVSAATNCTRGNDGVREFLADYRRRRTASLVERLERAVAQRELPPETDAQMLGDYYAMVLHGLSVQARWRVAESVARNPSRRHAGDPGAGGHSADSEVKVKLIGLLGGTGWPSTMLPYRRMNADVRRRLGGHHSARIVPYSIDYHEIKSRYWDRWSEIPALLEPEIARLLSFGPDFWMLANNTLHKAYDAIAADVAPVPFFHAVTLTRDHLVDRGLRSVLLLGTRFMMEDGLFARPLEAAGVTVTIPDAAERDLIQSIQSRLSKGETAPEFRAAFSALLERYERAGCEAVVTACTEPPLVIDQTITGMTVVDPLVLQCTSCVDFALA